MPVISFFVIPQSDLLALKQPELFRRISRAKQYVANRKLSKHYRVDSQSRAFEKEAWPKSMQLLSAQTLLRQACFRALRASRTSGSSPVPPASRCARIAERMRGSQNFRLCSAMP